MRKRLQVILTVLVALAIVGSCSGGSASENKTEQKQESTAVEQVQNDEEAAAKAKAAEEAAAKAKAEEEEAAKAKAEEEEAEPAALDLATVPAYSGSPYVQVLDNKPQFTDEDKARSSFEEYSPLDSLGRCGVAFALIGTETMPTEERGSIGMVKPSGWHTVRYDGLVDGNYLYNRCHLIGYQLAGENANTKNLITGTRYLNVEGMLPFEDKVADYVERTGNHVLYRVAPVFEGDNLVASGVQIEAWSVEDSGSGVSFDVYCYNVQPGVNIDYATGESSLAENAQTEEAAEEQAEEPAAETSSDATERSYVLNKNTKKFHLPGCSSAKSIKAKNREDFTGTRDEVISRGYEPCKKCNP